MKHTEESHPHRGWLERLSNALLREPQDREQLLELLHDARERQLLDSQALSMIEGVLKVSEMQVRDIMVPRPQMIVIEHDATAQETLPIIIQSAHSRFPVIGESRDDVLGILLAKDLLQHTIEEKRLKTQAKDLIRPAIFIPESKRLDALLKEFRANRNHMAIIIDEYGGVAGLVTIEDVLEQIVGDIEDEHDTTENDLEIKQLNQDEYMVNALTSIEDFNRYFSTQVNDEDFDTLGGFLMQQFGHIPKRGESICIENFELTVTLAGKRRIELLCLKKITDNLNEID